MSTRLDEYLDRAARDLPAMPRTADAVIRIVDDPESSLEDLRVVIDRDPAIATSVLKVANSALYGFPSRVESLGHAISLLGSRTIRNLVISASLKQTFRRFGLMEKLLWQHSALAGPVAAKLVSATGLDVPKEEAFTAALLHDLGKNALASSHRDEYEAVVARVYNEKLSFVEAEREQFGFDHAELGACVAERWQLPARLVSAIRHHHDPDALPDLPRSEALLAALAAVTTACLTRLGVGRREPVAEVDLARLPAWRFAGLSEEDVEPILELAAGEVKRGESILS